MAKDGRSFRAGEATWVSQLDGLRNVIRQEVIASHLAEIASPGMTVLDVGCGQGTQLLRLAEAGCTVTGVDPSDDLLGRFRSTAANRGVEVDAFQASLDDLASVVGSQTYDLVCAHGLLMYLTDRTAAFDALAARVKPDGLLSLTFRNGEGLAMRHGLRRNWQATLDALDSTTYVNELGVKARADRLEEVERELRARDLRIERWFGVRIFNDAVPAGTQVPASDKLNLLLHAEIEASRRDPYRRVASQTHVLARRCEGPSR
jgi:S-adenosylmethionine-dependent methyltransferase